MAKSKNPQPENHDDVLFETMQRNKRRRKRRIWITVTCIVLAVLLALTATVLYLRNRVRNKFNANATDVLTYAASIGSISTTVSGSGTLEDVDLEDITVPANVEVEEIVVSANDPIEVGDIIARVDLSSVMNAMAQVQAELDAFDDQLAAAEDDAVSTSLTAGVSGRVKEIYVAEGASVADCMYEHGALLLLSADGYLCAELEKEGLKEGASLRAVHDDGSEESAVVDSVRDGVAVVLLDDQSAKNGETLDFFDEEKALGSAVVEIHNPIRITGFAGTVERINVSENSKVEAGTKVLTLTDTEYSANYEAILRQREDKEEELMALLQLYHDGALLSPIAGSVSTVTDLDAAEEETVSYYYDTAATAETEQLIATVSPDKSMRITISVDESDILSLEKEQSVEITVDSIGEDVFEGYVSEINKTASSDAGVTSYSAEILLDKADKMLAGMSADAVIRIQGVEDAILVPVDALHQTSATSYVYTGYDESLKEYEGMVEVTTGLSNSNFVEITSGLNEGDVVYYTERKSSNPFFDAFGGMGSFGDMGSYGDMGSFGGMGGFSGQMPSGGGQMPSGFGRPSGGKGQGAGRGFGGAQ